MSLTGLSAFDKTIHETNSWIKDVAEELGIEERTTALKVLRAVLHALRDQLGPNTAAHLGDQLPILLRGIYYEAWHPESAPARIRDLDSFLLRIASEIKTDIALSLERVAKAVFAVIWVKVPPEEVAKLIRMMPEDLRVLWPRVAREE